VTHDTTVAHCTVHFFYHRNVCVQRQHRWVGQPFLLRAPDARRYPRGVPSFVHGFVRRAIIRFCFTKRDIVVSINHGHANTRWSMTVRGNVDQRNMLTLRIRHVWQCHGRTPHVRISSAFMHCIFELKIANDHMDSIVWHCTRFALRYVVFAMRNFRLSKHEKSILIG
jgi:hypothetical protein